jgi:hypothetical protein
VVPDVSEERRVPLNALHGVISQKKILFKTTAVKTSNPIYTHSLIYLTTQYLIKNLL